MANIRSELEPGRFRFPGGKKFNYFWQKNCKTSQIKCKREKKREKLKIGIGIKENSEWDGWKWQKLCKNPIKNEGCIVDCSIQSHEKAVGKG